MSTRTLTTDEIGHRGTQIYEAKIRSILEQQFHGQFVAIDGPEQRLRSS